MNTTNTLQNTEESDMLSLLNDTNVLINRLIEIEDLRVEFVNEQIKLFNIVS